MGRRLRRHRGHYPSPFSVPILEHVRSRLEDMEMVVVDIHVSGTKEAIAKRMIWRKTVGFEVTEYRDLADDDIDIDGSAILPWYWSLEGKFPGTTCVTSARPFGRQITDVFVASLEELRIAPHGTRKVSLLNLAADRLVAAGELKILTPMFFYVARMPLTAN
ncbi:sterol methyltransferase C-terminal-domain-containing protein [Cladochytrium replicatum]|nr:sterol methyltransferase C-terminal-domain-containing protein [Cladochytrium replicatum]